MTLTGISNQSRADMPVDKRRVWVFICSIYYDITGVSLSFTFYFILSFSHFHDLLRYPLNMSTLCGTLPHMYIIFRYSWDYRFDCAQFLFRFGKALRCSLACIST
jgi:hypothetical protein